MTPGLDWRADYADWPEALAKLEYCDRTMAELADRDPVVTADRARRGRERARLSLEEYYRRPSRPTAERASRPASTARSAVDLRGLRRRPRPPSTAPRRPASELIRRLERDLVANVYRWTGHFPERTRPLVRHLAERADS